MENNSVDDPVVDLDLNQEPIGSSTYDLRPFLDGIGVARDTEYRIRYLAYLTARARYRQRRQDLQNSVETASFSTEPALHVNDDGDGDGELLARETQTRLEPYERNMERGKGCKRDNSQLVAKALEMDTEVHINSQEGGGGNFYDCNICLYIAREPILTCCGHLFCWACFYKLPYADSFMKECPVCNGEVTDSTIVPIYGNGDSPRESKLDSSTVIPQRPRAQRVESARQQRVARGGFHIPVTEVLRRIRTSIGAINDDREQEGGSVDVHSGNSPQGPIGIMEQQRLRTQQLSRVITESGDSLSYISAALNSAERLVEDIETYINLRQFQRRNAQILSPIDEDSIARDAAGTTSQAEEQTSQPEEINPHAPATATATATAAPSSSRTNGVSENPRSSSGGGGGLNLPPPPSSRRRSSSRLTIRENDASHQTRRRRLR